MTVARTQQISVCRPGCAECCSLLSRKIAERAGASGEHYITTSHDEYFALWKAAIGGGFVTIFTAFFKLSLLAAGLPLFFEGFFSGVNYAASFVSLQLLGFTLATKQPSMTAAALAGKLVGTEGAKRTEEFTKEVTRIHTSIKHGVA